jgi:hypothetical protein
MGLFVCNVVINSWINSWISDVYLRHPGGFWRIEDFVLIRAL